MQEKDGTKQAKKRRGTAEKREVEQQEEGKRQAHRAAGAKTTNERLKPAKNDTWGNHGDLGRKSNSRPAGHLNQNIQDIVYIFIKIYNIHMYLSKYP
jgi:hypothetical protein